MLICRFLNLYIYIHLVNIFLKIMNLIIYV